jgi:N-hydroxyarylamine O-acetyltransferase
MTISLDAYFNRIGWTGRVHATLDCLQRLIVHHAAAIPFEALNPFLGLPVALDLQSLEQKLIREGRGGYCFEQNLLFSHVLTVTGFKVSCLAGRVLLGREADALPPRGHMLLAVDLDGETWIADAGFGGAAPPCALRLADGVEQATPLEPFRFTFTGSDWLLQIEQNGEWRPLYRFDLARQYPADYEFANYYHATHPASPFTGGLMAARVAPEGRLGLYNRQLSVTPRNGACERRILGSAQEIRDVLENLFRLNLSALPQLMARLEQLP